MFRELCIIKKSYDEDFLNKLKEIGYSIDDYAGDEKDCEYIINVPQCKAISFGWTKTFYLDIISNGAIECENKEQFLAIAAIRDDTDKWQWFKSDVCSDWFQSEIPQACDSWIGEPDKDDPFLTEEEKEGWQYFPYHKATVEELIEYFKTKQQ